MSRVQVSFSQLTKMLMWQALQKKFDSNQDDNEPAKKKLKLVKSTEVSTQTEPSFYSLARLKSLLPPLKNKPRPVDNSKIKITLDNDEVCALNYFQLFKSYEKV